MLSFATGKSETTSALDVEEQSLREKESMVDSTDALTILIASLHYLANEYVNIFRIILLTILNNEQRFLTRP